MYICYGFGYTLVESRVHPFTVLYQRENFIQDVLVS